KLSIHPPVFSLSFQVSSGDHKDFPRDWGCCVSARERFSGSFRMEILIFSASEWLVALKPGLLYERAMKMVLPWFFPDCFADSPDKHASSAWKVIFPTILFLLFSSTTLSQLHESYL